jgi:hypothetical protein
MRPLPCSPLALLRMPVRRRIADLFQSRRKDIVMRKTL